MHISYRPISIIFLSFIQKISKFLTFLPARRLSSKQLLFYQNMNGCFFLFLHICLKSRWNISNNIFGVFLVFTLIIFSQQFGFILFILFKHRHESFRHFLDFCSCVWRQWLNCANIHQWHHCVWRQWLYLNFPHLPNLVSVSWLCRISQGISQSKMAGEIFLEQNDVYYYTEVNTWQSQTVVCWSSNLFYPNIFQCSLDWFKCCLIMEMT